MPNNVNCFKIIPVNYAFVLMQKFGEIKLINLAGVLQKSKDKNRQNS